MARKYFHFLFNGGEREVGEAGGVHIPALVFLGVIKKSLHAPWREQDQKKATTKLSSVPQIGKKEGEERVPLESWFPTTMNLQLQKKW